MNLIGSIEEYITWFSLHGLATSGTHQESKMRINKFQPYPWLKKKLNVNSNEKMLQVWMLMKYYPYNLFGPAIMTYQKSPHLFLGIMLQKKVGCYWSTVESILNADRLEDCVCKVLFSARWNSICESTNQKSSGDQIHPATNLFSRLNSS